VRTRHPRETLGTEGAIVERHRTAFWFWLVISASFVLAALFHVHAAVTHSLPVWRHVLFAAVNLGVAWGCWRKPRWFIWTFGLLLLQQLNSHGLDLAQAWPERIDWNSVVVLLGMPLVALALWRTQGKPRDP
jgi:hypothetical protein